MSWKEEINRLSKDELTYELTVLGVTTLTDVNEMRKALRRLRKLQKSASFVFPDYPYTYDEDREALEAKVKEIESLVSTFSDSSKSTEYKKVITKLTHATSRLNRCKPTTDEQRRQVSQMLVSLTSLGSSLRSKAKQFVMASTLNASIVGTASSPIKSTGAVVESSDESSDDEAKPGDSDKSSFVPMSVSNYVPLTKWNLHFSGENSVMTVNAFLERVEELMVARHVTKEQVFRSALDLFSGKALVWYRANRKKLSDWDELIVALREEFQHPDYDEMLFDEIRRRTQGTHESIGMYVSIMSNLFSRLAIKIPESNRVRIMSKNLAPFYQGQLGLADARTVDELVALGKKLEQRRSYVENYVPPPRRNQSLEPDLAYVDSASVSTVSTERSSSVKCWNCEQNGHMAINCRQPRRKHCYKCGQPNVTTRTCNRCSLNSRRVR